AHQRPHQHPPRPRRIPPLPPLRPKDARRAPRRPPRPRHSRLPRARPRAAGLAPPLRAAQGLRRGPAARKGAPPHAPPPDGRRPPQAPRRDQHALLAHPEAIHVPARPDGSRGAFAPPLRDERQGRQEFRAERRNALDAWSINDSASMGGRSSVGERSSSSSAGTFGMVGGKPVNPVTGQMLESEEPWEGPKMTREEKEREAERLMVMFDRLQKNGIIKTENPMRTMQQEGRFEELSDDDSS
ncbi:hypothetical protein V498_10386, partial [Pseudogymnoascus sp. VKM F-4517 (FW-2822)]